MEQNAKIIVIELTEAISIYGGGYWSKTYSVVNGVITVTYVYIR